MSPLYEYYCFDCKVTIEKLEPLKNHDDLYETDLVGCPACSANMQYTLSPGLFNLKGKGFYKPTKQE